MIGDAGRGERFAQKRVEIAHPALTRCSCRIVFSSLFRA
jgi:hypothetical protein